jgi:hypothetical protein
MRFSTIALVAAVTCSAALNVSQWAASGLPIVLTDADSIVLGTGDYANPPQLSTMVKAERCTLAIPLRLTVPPYGFDIQLATAATLNVDGSWSIAPAALFHAAMVGEPMSWRLLLAAPVLPLASVTHGDYVNSHFCQGKV